MSDFLVIGEIIKPQGIKGELKVKPLTDDVERFFSLKNATIDGKDYKVLSVREYGGFAFIKMLGIDDRNAAESMVKKQIFVDRIHAVSLDADAFFIADILGCKLIVDGIEWGKVTDVLQNGAADIFAVKLSDGKTLLFPYLKKLGLSIDIQSKVIKAQEKYLAPVMVIND